MSRQVIPHGKCPGCGTLPKKQHESWCPVVRQAKARLIHAIRTQAMVMRVGWFCPVCGRHKDPNVIICGCAFTNLLPWVKGNYDR